MGQHRFHGQRIGHCTGVLPARAAKHGQGIGGHVIATLHRDALDGVRHVRIGDVNEALRHLLRAHHAASVLVDTGCQRGEGGHHHVPIHRLIGLWSEDFREVLRLQSAQHQVGVGHSQRPASPVTGRPRVGASRIGSDPQSRPIEMQNRAAAGRHRVNAHHRRAQAYSRHLGIKHPLKRAGVMRHIGGGAPHVKADHPLEPGSATHAGHADDPASWA